MAIEINYYSVDDPDQEKSRFTELLEPGEEARIMDFAQEAGRYIVVKCLADATGQVESVPMFRNTSEAVPPTVIEYCTKLIGTVDVDHTVSVRIVTGSSESTELRVAATNSASKIRTSQQ